MTVATTSDLAGAVSGSPWDAKSVWAEIDGDIHGPFTVSSGAFQVDVNARPVLVGIWTAPVYESMPYVRVLPNDDVVRRPGKIVTPRGFDFEDTASLAIWCERSAGARMMFRCNWCRMISMRRRRIIRATSLLRVSLVPAWIRH